MEHAIPVSDVGFGNTDENGEPLPNKKTKSDIPSIDFGADTITDRKSFHVANSDCDRVRLANTDSVPHTGGN